MVSYVISINGQVFWNLVLDNLEENSSEYVTLLGGDNNNLVEDQPEDLGPISTKHLLVWAYQIAKGMEYLGSMKVSAIFYNWPKW